MLLEPGAVVGERYQLDRILGEGGMGTVWAATHTVTRKGVALKFLRPEQSANPKVRQRFLREARAACAVRHPNVVAVHDVFETDDGAPLMVMDLLLGETLAAKLARERVLALTEVAQILLPVASAVGTAHALGIVHRDLKPENIFLAREGAGPVEVKVLDFGIAKLTSFEGTAASTSALTADGGMLGTPYYMSPEQVDGEKDIDSRSDVWALGIILYQCLSGTMPTNGENLGQVFKIITRGDIAPLDELVPGLPAGVSRLVARMMTRDRASRPQSMQEVTAILAPMATPSAGLSDSRVRIMRVSDSPRSPLASSLGDRATIAARTNEGTAQTVPPPRRSVPKAVVVGIAIATAGAGLWLAFGPSSRPQPTPAVEARVAVQVPAPSSVPPSVATSSVAPVPSASALPAAIASPAPSAIASAPAPTARVQRPRPVHSGGAGAAPTVAPVAPPAAPADRPGGVYEKAPF